MSAAYLSFSHIHLFSQPRLLSPSSKPPAPVKSDPYVSIGLFFLLVVFLCVVCMLVVLLL